MRFLRFQIPSTQASVLVCDQPGSTCAGWQAQAGFSFQVECCEPSERPCAPGNHLGSEVRGVKKHARSTLTVSRFQTTDPPSRGWLVLATEVWSCSVYLVSLHIMSSCFLLDKPHDQKAIRSFKLQVSSLPLSEGSSSLPRRLDIPLMSRHTAPWSPGLP